MSDHYDKLKKTHVALLHETWRQSAARDLTTAATFVGLWSLGHWAGSSALEWVGVIIGFLALFARVDRLLRGAMNKRMTPQQAREWLDREFPNDQ